MNTKKVLNVQMIDRLVIYFLLYFVSSVDGNSVDREIEFPS